MSKIVGVLLAAGSSSRMGQPKQLLSFKGQPMINHMVTKLEVLELEEIFVVLGAFQDQIQSVISSANVSIISNSRWAEGMGTSVRIGMKEALARHSDLDGILYILVDQPYLTSVFLKKLIEAFKVFKSDLIASKYNDLESVPALFGKAYFEELISLEGDKGARKIIRSHAAKVYAISFEGGQYDLDTPQDWEQFLKNVEK